MARFEVFELRCLGESSESGELIDTNMYYNAMHEPQAPESACVHHRSMRFSALKEADCVIPPSKHGYITDRRTSRTGRWQHGRWENFCHHATEMG